MNLQIYTEKITQYFNHKGVKLKAKTLIKKIIKFKTIKIWTNSANKFSDKKRLFIIGDHCDETRQWL